MEPENMKRTGWPTKALLGIDEIDSIINLITEVATFENNIRIFTSKIYISDLIPNRQNGVLKTRHFKA